MLECGQVALAFFDRLALRSDRPSDGDHRRPIRYGSTGAARDRPVAGARPRGKYPGRRRRPGSGHSGAVDWRSSFRSPRRKVGRTEARWPVGPTWRSNPLFLPIVERLEAITEGEAFIVDEFGGHPGPPGSGADPADGGASAAERGARPQRRRRHATHGCDPGGRRLPVAGGRQHPAANHQRPGGAAGHAPVRGAGGRRGRDDARAVCHQPSPDATAA